MAVLPDTVTKGDGSHLIFLSLSSYLHLGSAGCIHWYYPVAKFEVAKALFRQVI